MLIFLATLDVAGKFNVTLPFCEMQHLLGVTV